MDESKYGNVNVPFYGEQDDLFYDWNMDLWTMNAIYWNLEKKSNLIVFADLVLPQVLYAELGCISMIQNFISYLGYDDTLDMPYMYNVMTRIPGIYHGAGSGIGYDTFAKDW